MKWSNSYRMRLVLVGVVVTILLGDGIARADFAFGEPENLGPTVNSGYSEAAPSISADGLELYFNSDRPAPGLDQWNIWMVTRPTKDDNWGDPVPLSPEINSIVEDDWPQLSPDGLELYFSRPPADEGLDILVTRRPTLSESWGPAANIGPPINTPDHHEYSASITRDGLELFFVRESYTADPDIWTAKRASRNESWGEPVSLGLPINTSASESLSYISADGLVLCFSSFPAHSKGVIPGGQGSSDIWISTRPTRNAPWGKPWNPGPPLNTVLADCLPSISADGRWLYFSDYWWNSPKDVRPGGYGSDDLWKARIFPVVDFNGNGIIDSADVCFMVEHWGESYSLCDIGPMPWGDGGVDVEDLKVLAEQPT